MQHIQVRWSNAIIEMFHMKNGVKQGAVLSPKLFTVVLDGLFDNYYNQELVAVLITYSLEHLVMLMILCY